MSQDRSMNLKRYAKPLLAIGLIAGLLGAGFATKNRWMPLLHKANSAQPAQAEAAAQAPPAVTNKVIVGDQAQQNLGLSSKPLKAGPYWKHLTVQGTVIDRPGRGDCEVAALTTG